MPVEALPRSSGAGSGPYHGRNMRLSAALAVVLATAVAAGAACGSETKHVPAVMATGGMVPPVNVAADEEERVRLLSNKELVILQMLSKGMSNKAICDRLVLLSGGRVAGEGTLAELRAKANLSDGGLEEVFLALT